MKASGRVVGFTACAAPWCAMALLLLGASLGALRPAAAQEEWVWKMPTRGLEYFGGLVRQEVSFNTSDHSVVGGPMSTYFTLKSEVHYRLSPDAMVFGKFWFCYDWNYDIRDGSFEKFKHSRKRVQSEIWTDNQEAELIRELYLDLHLHDVPFLEGIDLRLGRQVVGWGEMDGFRLCDIVNPLDLTREFALRDEGFDETRIPLWMAKVNFLLPSPTPSLQDLAIEVCLIPDVRPNRFYVGERVGGVWAFPNVLVPSVAPWPSPRYGFDPSVLQRHRAKGLLGGVPGSAFLLERGASTIFPGLTDPNGNPMRIREECTGLTQSGIARLTWSERPTSLDNMEYAVRLLGRWGKTYFTLNFFYGWDDMPIGDLRKTGVWCPSHLDRLGRSLKIPDLRDRYRQQLIYYAKTVDPNDPSGRTYMEKYLLLPPGATKSDPEGFVEGLLAQYQSLADLNPALGTDDGEFLSSEYPRTTYRNLTSWPPQQRVYLDEQLADAGLAGPGSLSEALTGDPWLPVRNARIALGPLAPFEYDDPAFGHVINPLSMNYTVTGNRYLGANGLPKYVKLFYPRRKAVGFTITRDMTELKWRNTSPVLRIECLYDFEKAFNTDRWDDNDATNLVSFVLGDEVAQALGLPACDLSKPVITPIPKKERITHKDMLSLGVGWDWPLWARWLNPRQTIWTSVQFAWYHVFNYPDDVKLIVAPYEWRVHEDSYWWTLMLNTRYMHDRLRPQILIVRDVQDDSWGIKPKCQYFFGRSWRYAVELGGIIYEGRVGSYDYYGFHQKVRQEGWGGLFDDRDVVYLKFWYQW